MWTKSVFGGWGMRKKKIALIATVMLLSVAVLSCNSIAKESSPVLLVVSGTQNLNQIDLQAGAAGCGVSLGTVQMTVKLLQNQSDPLLRLHICGRTAASLYRPASCARRRRC